MRRLILKSVLLMGQTVALILISVICGAFFLTEKKLVALYRFLYARITHKKFFCLEQVEGDTTN